MARFEKPKGDVNQTCSDFSVTPLVLFPAATRTGIIAV